ncbi:MAG: outer membrane lipoprotein carrier protein LolA [Prevotellaceae bacterium]|jgi:outer membrane lipoprotein-sorting protein|nr:outer membrane lipoprotein carrier protein LolA [Prevotellaceae bacterium]
MKKKVLWVCLFLFPICGYTQASRIVLQHFLERMTAGPVEMSFTFTSDNVPKKVHDLQTGVLLYSGEQYHLQLGELDIYCDGISKWIYNGAVEEVTVLPAEEADDMTDNPLKYIMHNEDNFRYRPVKHLTQKGKKIISVDLIPKSKDAVYTMVNLQVEEKTFLPVQLTYKMKDGQRYIIDVNRIDVDIAVKSFSFSFPAQLYSGITINDLR